MNERLGKVASTVREQLGKLASIVREHDFSMQRMSTVSFHVHSRTRFEFFVPSLMSQPI